MTFAVHNIHAPATVMALMSGAQTAQEVRHMAEREERGRHVWRQR